MSTVNRDTGLASWRVFFTCFPAGCRFFGRKDSERISQCHSISSFVSPTTSAISATLSATALETVLTQDVCLARPVSRVNQHCQGLQDTLISCTLDLDGEMIISLLFCLVYGCLSGSLRYQDVKMSALAFGCCKGFAGGHVDDAGPQELCAEGACRAMQCFQQGAHGQLAATQVSCNLQNYKSAQGPCITDNTRSQRKQKYASL